MAPARIACVRYLNTAPLIEGLDKLDGVTILPAVPSSIAGMVASGDADVGLCSLVDAAQSAEPLAILPVGMIGCDGPTLTVRLFSTLPLDRITTLHADTDSHTSVVLARLLLARLHNARPALVNFDARERVPRAAPAATAGAADAPLHEAWPPAVLLIGDKVVVDAPPADRYPHQLDLGEAWHALTGLPFVYAAWMCRRSQVDAPAVRSAMALLDRQRRHNATRTGWIVARRAPEHRWPPELAERYLTRLLRYDLDARARQGAERFLADAADLGLLPRRAPDWVDPAAVPVPGALPV